MKKPVTQNSTQSATSCWDNNWYQSRSFGLPNPHYKPKPNTTITHGTRSKGKRLLNAYKNTISDDEDRNAEISPRPTHKHHRLKCFICKKRGHSFWSCKDRSNAQGMTSKPRSVSPNSPNFQISEREFYPKIYIDGDYMVKGTDSGNWSNIWYISKLQRQHLAQNKKVFENFKYKYYAQRLNGEDILVRGIGQVLINVENLETLIDDVLFCPNININVLSLNQLWEQGYDIRIDNFKAEIFNRNDPGWWNMTRGKIETQIRNDLREMEIETENRKRLLEEPLTKPNVVTPERLTEMMEFIDFVLKADARFFELKSDLEKQFEEMISWFNKSEYSSDLYLPKELMIGPKKVSLIDLYRLVKEAGGVGLVTLERRWTQIAFALGFPDWYEIKIKDGFVKYLQKVDMCYDIMKTAYEYQEVEEENDLVVRDHTTFMRFMDLLHNSNSVEYKRMLRNSFEEVIAWFHTELVDGDPNLPMPPMIGRLQICLYDLYVYLLSEGGMEQDDGGWQETALTFGLHEDDHNAMKGIVKRYLLMPYTYYISMVQYIEGGASNYCSDTQVSYSSDGDLASEPGCSDSLQWSRIDRLTYDNIGATNLEFASGTAGQDTTMVDGPYINSDRIKAVANELDARKRKLIATPSSEPGNAAGAAAAHIETETGTAACNESGPADNDETEAVPEAVNETETGYMEIDAAEAKINMGSSIKIQRNIE